MNHAVKFCRTCQTPIPEGRLFCSLPCSLVEMWAEVREEDDKENRQKQIDKLKKRGADELAKLEVTIQQLAKD